jgi:hypothetical protein
MVFNATFNNNSVIWWRSVLLVEETGVPGEIQQLVTNGLNNTINSKENTCRGCSGRDRMIVWLTTKCAISVYHHWSCEFESAVGIFVINYEKNMLNILKESNYIVHVFYFFTPLESQNEQQFVEIELSCLITDYDFSITGVH